MRVLHQGWDTLSFNIWGELKPEWVELLDWAKRDAQAAGDDWAVSPLPAFDGTTPMMHASGVKYYQWRMVSADVTVTIAGPGRSPRPSAVVRVSSAALWRLGGGGLVAARLAEDYLRELYQPGSYRVQVGYGHLATDYQGRPPGYDDRHGLVKRADGVTWHDGDDGALESIWAGRSDHLRVQLYNKSREIPKRQKGWFRDLWALAAGYRGDQDVWRLECQFGRDFLHGRGIETLDDLEAATPALWRYGCEWFSFRTSDGDSNRSRWPVAAWWAALSEWGGQLAGELARVAQVRPQAERLALALVGYVTSLAAVVGLDDVDDAIAGAFRVHRARHGRDGLDLALDKKRLRYGANTMAAYV